MVVSGEICCVRRTLLRAPPSNLYHSIMRSPSFGLPSPNQNTPPDLRARDNDNDNNNNNDNDNDNDNNNNNGNADKLN